MNLADASSKVRIGGAIFLGAIIIGGALYLRETKTAEVTGGVEIVPVAPRESQDTKDTDGDGIPDWQEDIYGTDYLVFDAELPAGATSTEEKETLDDIPDSFTKRFGVDFMSTYIAQNGGDLDMGDDERAKFVQEAANAAASQIKDTPIARADIIIKSASDQKAIYDYGNALGAVMSRHLLPGENELVITSRAVQENNPEELKKLIPIINAYANLIASAKLVPVPVSLVNEHLALLNALQAIHNDIVAMQQVFDDPLPALVRIQSYYQKSLGELLTSAGKLRDGLTKGGATYTERDPAWVFFTF